MSHIIQDAHAVLESTNNNLIEEGRSKIGNRIMNRVNKPAAKYSTQTKRMKSNQDFTENYSRTKRNLNKPNPILKDDNSATEPVETSSAKAISDELINRQTRLNHWLGMADIDEQLAKQIALYNNNPDVKQLVDSLGSSSSSSLPTLVAPNEIGSLFPLDAIASFFTDRTAEPPVSLTVNENSRIPDLNANLVGNTQQYENTDFLNLLNLVPNSDENRGLQRNSGFDVTTEKTETSTNIFQGFINKKIAFFNMLFGKSKRNDSKSRNDSSNMFGMEQASALDLDRNTFPGIFDDYTSPQFKRNADFHPPSSLPRTYLPPGNMLKNSSPANEHLQSNIMKLAVKNSIIDLEAENHLSSDENITPDQFKDFFSKLFPSSNSSAANDITESPSIANTNNEGILRSNNQTSENPKKAFDGFKNFFVNLFKPRNSSEIVYETTTPASNLDTDTESSDIDLRTDNQVIENTNETHDVFKTFFGNLFKPPNSSEIDYETTTHPSNLDTNIGSSDNGLRTDYQAIDNTNETHGALKSFFVNLFMPPNSSNIENKMTTPPSTLDIDIGSSDVNLRTGNQTIDNTNMTHDAFKSFFVKLFKPSNSSVTDNDLQSSLSYTYTNPRNDAPTLEGDNQSPNIQDSVNQFFSNLPSPGTILPEDVTTTTTEASFVLDIFSLFSKPKNTMSNDISGPVDNELPQQMPFSYNLVADNVRQYLNNMQRRQDSLETYLVAATQPAMQITSGDEEQIKSINRQGIYPSHSHYNLDQLQDSYLSSDMGLHQIVQDSMLQNLLVPQESTDNYVTAFNVSSNTVENIFRNLRSTDFHGGLSSHYDSEDIATTTTTTTTTPKPFFFGLFGPPQTTENTTTSETTISSPQANFFANMLRSNVDATTTETPTANITSPAPNFFDLFTIPTTAAAAPEDESTTTKPPMKVDILQGLLDFSNSAVTHIQDAATVVDSFGAAASRAIRAILDIARSLQPITNLISTRHQEAELKMELEQQRERERSAYSNYYITA